MIAVSITYDSAVTWFDVMITMYYLAEGSLHKSGRV